MQMKQSEVEQFLLKNPEFLDRYVFKHISIDILHGWISDKLRSGQEKLLPSPRSFTSSEFHLNAREGRQGTWHGKQGKLSSFDNHLHSGPVMTTYISLLESLFQCSDVGYEENYALQPTIRKRIKRETYSPPAETNIFKPVSNKEVCIPQDTSTKNNSLVIEDSSDLICISGNLAQLAVSMVEKETINPNRENSTSNVKNKDDSLVEASTQKDSVLSLNEKDCTSKLNGQDLTASQHSIKSECKTDAYQPLKLKIKTYPCPKCGKLFIAEKYRHKHMDIKHSRNKSQIKNEQTETKYSPVGAKHSEGKSSHNLINFRQKASQSISQGLIRYATKRMKEEGVRSYQNIKADLQGQFDSSENNEVLRLPRTGPKSLTRRKIYHCDGKGCDKSYWTYSSLMRHKILHAEHNPFICMYCGFAFQTNADLKRHIYRHTGERPYCCDKCGRGFIQRSILKDHIRKQHKTETVEKSHTGKSSPLDLKSSNVVPSVGLPNSFKTDLNAGLPDLL